jgi:uncharacterized membrane protein
MFLKLYAIALPVIVMLDMVWLGIVAKDFYKSQLGYIMRSDFNLTVAAIFYVIFTAAIVIFVIAPAAEKQSLSHALLLGFFFGFTTYAAYDLTNLATLKDWPIMVTIVDMVWGGILSALVSTITLYLATRII